MGAVECLEPLCQKLNCVVSGLIFLKPTASDLRMVQGLAHILRYKIMVAIAQ